MIRFFQQVKYFSTGLLLNMWNWGLRMRRECHERFSRHRLQRKPLVNYSVETPSMVGPQWNILNWESKWIFQTVCWGVVGYGWGTTSFYFGIAYICFNPGILPLFAVGPKYYFHFFLFLSKVSFKGHTQNFKKISCRFQTWMGIVGQELIKLGTSPIWGFLYLPFDVLLGVTYANTMVANQWPLKRAPQLTSFVGLCVVWKSER